MSAFFAVVFVLGLGLANAVNFTTVYDWNQLDFIWPSGANSYIEEVKRSFNPKSVEFQYMAVFGERLFLSLDWKYGLPATLVWLPTSGTSTASPTLTPFPSWNLHERNKCDTIQTATGLETDIDGRLWVVDDGTVACPGKIWIFDLLNKDKTEHIHQFPDAVVTHEKFSRGLRDIVLDKTPDDYIAYIRDANSEHIVAYSRKMDKSWSVKTSRKKWKSFALSPSREARQLYLSKSFSDDFYSVSVSELRSQGESADAKLLGQWKKIPSRMLIDSANVLYAAFFNANYLAKWNISEPFHEQRFHEFGELGAIEPFTFALDSNGTLWLTEQNETGGANRHKLLKASIGTKSYLYSPRP
ncbi:protein yellow-like [Cloeon dipterum]|uniref:protein yellow-like n=1 Tax=Cloeon dipterum TaxID=197152 RepID=UPI0032201881